MACLKAGQLLGRMLKVSSALTAAPSSINTLGFWKTLRVLAEGVDASVRRAGGIGADAFGAAVAQSTVEHMFRAFSASVGGLEAFLATAGTGIAIHELSRKISRSAAASANATRTRIERSIAAYSMTETTALLLLLIGAYVASVDRVGTREELQGLYILAVWVTTVRDVLFERMYGPVSAALGRLPSMTAVASRLSRGIVCREVDAVETMVNQR